MDPCATISRDPFRAQLSSFGNSADVANSLFRKILRITLFESIFCQLTSRYPFRNFQRIKILQTRVKKIRGGYLPAVLQARFASASESASMHCL